MRLHQKMIWLLMKMRVKFLSLLFISDINEALIFVRLNPNYEVTGMASIYGTTQSIPDKSIVKELSRHYQDLYYKLN